MLEAYKHKRLDGAEPFHIGADQLPFDTLTYWRWSHSNLLDNTSRGILAEFLVASALGLADGVRNTWDPFDIQTADGIKVEVKSSAYIQSWGQKTHSKISFTVRQTRNWNETENTYAKDPSRQADVYVFCLLAHKDKATIDPMNLDQWCFYVVSSKTLDEKLGTQKSVVLSRLVEIGALPVGYADLKASITDAFTKTK